MLGEIDGRAENGERCVPLIRPSTTVFAISSRLPIRDRTSGIDKLRAG